jgi:ATP-dependent RNA helicase SUPV3L1/SUV3
LPEIRARASSGDAVRLLWDVCRVPDFRGISHAEHASLLEAIFRFLHQDGRVPDDWLATHIRRIDRTDGDIDTLSKRLAYIRTWTYVAQRRGWTRDESHWRGETRAVEDRLSDALHERLTQRFVDRRTSVLLRRLKQKEGLVAEVNDKGEVTVEGQHVGRLDGFRFTQDASASPEEARTLRSAALSALTPEYNLRADRFYNTPDTEIDFTEQGGLMWGTYAVGKLVKGPEPLRPVVEAFVDEEAGPDVAAKVQRRLQHFIDRKIATQFEPLIALGKDETLTGLARGFAFRMVETFGIIPRETVANEVKELDQDARGMLRKHAVRFGQFTIFIPALLKPAPTRLRIVLWSLAEGLVEFPESPPPGLVTVPAAEPVRKGYFAMSGYRQAGDRAIRIDMLERLADMVRAKDTRAGFEATPDMLSITGLTLEQFAALMTGLGYRAQRGEREKLRAVADAAADAAPEAAPDPVAADSAPQTAPEAVTEPEAAPAEPVEAIAEPAAEPAPEPAEGEAAPEVEVFYIFTWGGNRPSRREGAPGGQPGSQRADRGDRGERGERKERHERQGGKPEHRQGGEHKGRGKPKHGKGGKPGGSRDGDRKEGARTFEARPPKKDRIDPDNPFAAALMGLRTKD